MASTAVQSGLQLYLRQINESPLLTAQQEKEGKNHLGAHNQRESSRAMGGKSDRLFFTP